jgi:hypothetical protein
MPFEAGDPEPPASAEHLMRQGIARERAILAEAIGHRRWDLSPPLTRSQLATRAGLNPRQVAKLEAGTLDPYFFATLIKLAHVLRLNSLDELLGFLPLEDLRR